MRVPVLQLRGDFANWISRIKEASVVGRWDRVLLYYVGMRKSGVCVTDLSVLPPVLKACSEISVRLGKSVHGCLIKQGFDLYTAIRNSTLDFYVKCGELGLAHSVFESMGRRDSVSWNIMIRGYLGRGYFIEGLLWFRKAREDAFEPNVSTLVLVIHACRRAYIHGVALHGFIIRGGFTDFSSVQNSLLSMYVDMDMKYACNLFHEMCMKDVISWSVMISGYVQSGKAQVGLQMFKEMLCKDGVGPDGIILVSVLNGCADLGDSSMGRLCHGLVIYRGLYSDLFVKNSLIDMYSKCKDPESALKVFNEMFERNSITWNCILSGLVLNERHPEALSLYYSMKKEGIESDEVTLMSILQVCKSYVQPLGSKSVHCVMIRKGHETNELLHNSLIDVYARCDKIDLAWKVFNGMNRKDVVSWSTMIAAFTSCGKPDEAVAIFHEMKKEHMKPNAVTIVNLLEACSAIAELTRSKWAHGIVIRTEMAADVVVGTAVVDMYSKCGAIDASRKAFAQLPQKNIFSWSAMIAAYGMNGLARDALAMLKEMKVHNFKPNAVTCLSVLSACSHGGLVEEGLRFFKSMTEEHGIEPGAEHYSCMVDMLGRAGKLDFAMELIMKMPERLKAGASLWAALLSACRTFGNSELGESIVSHVIQSEPFSSAGYMLASSMYASRGLWVDAAKIRRLVKERRVRVVAGYSLLHVGDRTFKFVARDESHPQAGGIHITAEQLHSCMKIGLMQDLEITE